MQAFIKSQQRLLILLVLFATSLVGNSTRYAASAQNQQESGNKQASEKKTGLITALPLTISAPPITLIGGKCEPGPSGGKSAGGTAEFPDGKKMDLGSKGPPQSLKKFVEGAITNAMDLVRDPESLALLTSDDPADQLEFFNNLLGEYAAEQFFQIEVRDEFGLPESTFTVNLGEVLPAMDISTYLSLFPHKPVCKSFSGAQVGPCEPTDVSLKTLIDQLNATGDLFEFYKKFAGVNTAFPSKSFDSFPDEPVWWEIPCVKEGVTPPPIVALLVYPVAFLDDGRRVVGRVDSRRNTISWGNDPESSLVSIGRPVNVRIEDRFNENGQYYKHDTVTYHVYDRVEIEAVYGKTGDLLGRMTPTARYGTYNSGWVRNGDELNVHAPPAMQIGGGGPPFYFTGQWVIREYLARDLEWRPAPNIWSSRTQATPGNLLWENEEVRKPTKIRALYTTAPATPVIDGPQNSGVEGQPVAIRLTTTDAEGEPVTYFIDWGDGGKDTVLVNVPGDYAAPLSHTYTAPGAYLIDVLAQNRFSEYLSATSDSAFYRLAIRPSNHRPNRPLPPQQAIQLPPAPNYAGRPYTFHTTATDPDGDSIQYFFDWGDEGRGGEAPYYTDYVASGQLAGLAHIWRTPGIYDVRVQARDRELYASTWSDSLAVAVILPASLRTDKKIYRPGEPIEISFTNTSPFPVSLRSPVPWVIRRTPSNSLVYAPISLAVIVPVAPGETKKWIWDQRTSPRGRASWGTYKIEFSTTDGVVYTTTFRISG